MRLLQKRYSVYALGPNGPKTDDLIKSFWLRKNAAECYIWHSNVSHNSQFGIYDNTAQRWIGPVYR